MTSKEALSDLYFLAIGEQEHISKCKEIIEKDLDRLERLEAIEDEIEIPLIELFDIYNKLCKQEFVYIKIGNKIKCEYYDYYVIDFKNKEIVAVEYEPVDWLPFKDCGITWALSREELKE